MEPWGEGLPVLQQPARRLLQGGNVGGGVAAANATDDPLQTLQFELFSLWTLVCAFLVFFMQCGFALLEAGSVRVKNTRNILLKNVVDACASSLAWWAVGSAFAGGECGGFPFVGTKNFFTADAGVYSATGFWAGWFYGWAFSATAATIVSGAVAERCQFRAYVVYTLCIASFVYPPVAHWVWSASGWLSARRVPNCGSGGYAPLFAGTNGLIDFAGSGVVHMVGGAAALVGAAAVGPRNGRFTADGLPVDMPRSSHTNMALGTFILWLGWYGFNSGSVVCSANVSTECLDVAALVAANTALAASAGGAACLAAAVVYGAAGDIGPLLNGILAGAVSITASCAVVQPYAAVAVGAAGGCIYLGASRGLRRARVDDPLDAAAVHLFCGAWGLLVPGLLATEGYTAAAYGYADGFGAFYGGGGKQLGVQLLGLATILAWSASLSGAVFLALRRAGWLRVSAADEAAGLDASQAVGSGYASCLNLFAVKE